MAKKIKIAFIKFAGMSAGGTEKFLQTIAANLSRDRFEVDYFYCDSAPYIGSNFVHPDTSGERLLYMQQHNVNLVKFKVKAKDVTSGVHEWVDTDFWEFFDESKYDIIQTGRAGHPEYPFNKIRKTPIVDSLHLFAGVDNQTNISRVMHLCQWSADKWISAGGDRQRVVLVSHPMDIPNKDYGNLRSELGLEEKFIFGFHQRNDDRIFSPYPLEAYQKIQDANNAFLLLGGGQAYREQARELGLKNIFFLPHSANPDGIYKFLSTLNVYAHGRKDGEINSTAMAEAMFFGLPIVSHISKINNGHVECIGSAGKVVNSVSDYIKELQALQNDQEYYKKKSAAAKQRFSEKYELKSQIANIENIYEQILANPFPNKILRILSSFRIKYLLLFSFVRLFNKLKRTFNF